MTGGARQGRRGLLLFSLSFVVAAAQGTSLLTGTQATFSLASALTRGTPIEVLNVPEDGRQLALMKDYIARRMDTLAPTFADATAVVSLTNALPNDPLYRYAREANIRIIDVDAAIPWSLSSSGVALIDAPVSSVDWAGDTDADVSSVAPYFWLSISNAIRMGDIIAHDLAQIFPDSAAVIAENLDDLKRELLALRNGYQSRLIEIGEDTVFALTGDFVYLTNDMGLFVDGYFIKQDIRWTQADLTALTGHLEERGIHVVVHEWMPSAEIRDAISEAGAELVVLDTADPGMVVEGKLVADGLQQILRRNLDALVSALNR